MNTVRRWLLPLFLGTALVFALSRTEKPIAVFASEEDRIAFLREIGEEQEVQLIALVTDWCPACRALEYSLDTEGIPYAKVDLERSVPGRQLFEKAVGLGASRAIPKTIYGLTMISAPDAISRVRADQRIKESTAGSQ